MQRIYYLVYPLMKNYGLIMEIKYWMWKGEMQCYFEEGGRDVKEKIKWKELLFYSSVTVKLC